MKILGIILAGGFGTRLRKYLPFSLPKCLLPCKGRPLIVNVVENICNVCDSVYILVNKVDYKVYEQFLKIFNVLNDKVKLIVEPTEVEEKKLGSVGALYWFVKGKLGEVESFDYVLVTPCDIYFGNGYELLKILDLVTRYNTVVIGVAYVHPIHAKYFGVVKTIYDIHTGVEKVINFIEKPFETTTGTVFTGVTLIPSKLFTEEIINYIEKHRGDPDKLGNFIKYMVEKKHKVLTYLIKEWLDVGIPELFDEYERICLE